MDNFNDNVDLDDAYRIIMEANADALKACKEKGLSPSNSYQALIQNAFRNYADILGSDAEAIRQIREFLAEWETELTVKHH